MKNSLSACPACQHLVSISASACPSCGHPIGTPTAKSKRTRKLVLWATGVSAAAILMLGNFHVVSGADGKVFIKRVSFGFEDAFGSVSDCTSVPWLAAMANHGKLCKALQNAEVLESDASREARIKAEFEREMKVRQKEIEERMEKAQKEWDEKMNEIMKKY